MMQRLAIKAHNLEVEGSNPSPATTKRKSLSLADATRLKGNNNEATTVIMDLRVKLPPAQYVICGMKEWQTVYQKRQSKLAILL